MPGIEPIRAASDPWKRYRSEAVYSTLRVYVTQRLSILLSGNELVPMGLDTKTSDPRDSYEFFLSERSGISFDQLAAFSRPLLELFDVDPHHWDMPRTIPTEPELLDSYSSALAAAEVFWSYFTLDTGIRKKFTPELRAYFIGSEPAPHEIADFTLLISCMEAQWLKVTGGRRVPTPTSNPLDLPVVESESDQLEVLALFGEPLMEDHDCLDDPDELESVMQRINAYWQLAHASDAEFDARLLELVNRFSDASRSKEFVRDEALRMVERYNLLFREE